MSGSTANSQERIFDWEVQEQFAHFSGDRNPMHMDAIAARRTHAGQPVVHGVNAVLWALDALANSAENLQPIARLKVSFQKLIYVGDTVTVEVVRREDSGLTAQLCVDGLPVTQIKIGFGPLAKSPQSELILNELPSPQWPEQPATLTLAQIEHAGGALAFARNPDAAEQLFPALSALIGVSRVSALACMSRLVGMVCPGLHSTFFSLSLDAVEDPLSQPGLRFQVAGVHHQFRLVRQTVFGGGWSGTLESIARIPPVAQPSMGDLLQVVRPDEFAHTHALIVGGSRGLGELTAKLIAAGGGAVTMTYAVGRDDAFEVQQQIRAGGGKCDVLRYDATLPASGQLAQLAAAPTSLYYFATTPIFLRKTKLFSPEIFQSFYRVYVEGFHEACAAALRDSLPGSSIFYPSSIAVEDRPLDLTEYAMAKAAGEILVADLARAKPEFRFVVERLPRMLTDQTATTMPVKSVAPLDVLLPIVRRMEARTIS
jgi:hypothetical protein